MQYRMDDRNNPDGTVSAALYDPRVESVALGVGFRVRSVCLIDVEVVRIDGDEVPKVGQRRARDCALAVFMLHTS